jgi:glycosyl transferase family 4
VLYFRSVTLDRPRMLAVVSRFKWVHIDYLAALEKHFDVFVAWSGEGGKGAPGDGMREGMSGVPVGWIPDVGVEEVRSRLEEVISEWRPDVVHVMYYNHEELMLIVRELVGDATTVVFECRDPLSTLMSGQPGSGEWACASWWLEHDAILASDAQIFVSQALRSYLERRHGLDLGATSLIVPNGFARHTIGPPSPKLSAGDGRVHIALVGTADDSPDEGRWYGDIIRRLVSRGLVVHSHFWDLEGRSLEPYRALARELDDYHHWAAFAPERGAHPTVLHREATVLSDLISRYDLMGVFHELEAPEHNESATLAVCLPTKAVSGWLHGGIPVVCFPHYRGVVERIEALDIGFVVDDLEGVGRIASDREAIAAATERCLACRDRFTNEHNAERVRDFVEPLLGRPAERAPRAPVPARLAG